MQANCAIELKLDECLGRLISRANAMPVADGPSCTRSFANGASSGTPAPKVLSWLNLPSLPAFTARVMSCPDSVVPNELKPPLSSYAHDDALVEVAKNGSKGARILTADADPSSRDVGGNDVEPPVSVIEPAAIMASSGTTHRQLLKCTRPVQDTRKLGPASEWNVNTRGLQH